MIFCCTAILINNDIYIDTIKLSRTLQAFRVTFHYLKLPSLKINAPNFFDDAYIFQCDKPSIR